MAVVLYIAICVCAIAYPYFANLIKISSRNRKIRKLKEEIRELEEEIKKNKKILDYLTKLYDLNDQEFNVIANKLRVQMAIKALLKHQMTTNSQQRESKKEQ